MLGFADSITSAECVPVVLRAQSADDGVDQHRPGRPAAGRGARRRDRGRSAGGTGLAAGGDGRRGPVLAAEMCRTRRCSTTARLRVSPASASLVTRSRRLRRVLWRCRTDAAGLATRRADGAEAWGGWEDAAVPPRAPGATTCAASTSCWGGTACPARRTGTSVRAACTCGSTSTCSAARGLATYREFVEQATDLVVALGGSVSGEHGDGRARSELLGRMYGADGLRAARRNEGHLGPGPA